ncbi:MAG: hypothetical protein JWQ71_288 [Pedosphaera sp.]|nr:hypothetical protein [Pedosphaera sp.]
MPNPKRLLVVARVNHYQYGGRLYAYTPYARELEVWADLFSEVMIAGSCLNEPPPGDCTPFNQKNITLLPVIDAGGDGFKAKFGQIFSLPKIIWQLACYMRRADAIHVRCPCDLGLLGVLMAPVFSRFLIAKYATQWLPFAGEPWAWRLQRILLGSAWWRGLVTVYGRWPNQPKKVIPFFTSMLTREQIVRARTAASRSKSPDILRIVYVGRLSSSKNVDVLLSAIASVKLAVRRVECTIIGEGPQRAALETQAVQFGLSNRVTFTGGLGLDKVLGYYEQAHVLVLASDIEGWPKAIAEGMAFGLVCIGTERGMMPQMLGEGRGFLVPPRNVKDLAAALQWVVENPHESAAMAAKAAAWAQQYSLEGLREALRDLMTDRWGLTKVPLHTSDRTQEILAQ